MRCLAAAISIFCSSRVLLRVAAIPAKLPPWHEAGTGVLERMSSHGSFADAADVRMEHLRRSDRSSFCEWKGQAIYYDVVVGERVSPASAWSYPTPSPSFSSIKDHIAFYPQAMDACWVDGERVTPQPGAQGRAL